jgi:hypothetical protein
MSDRPQRPRPERTAPNRNPGEMLGVLGGAADAPGGDPISRSVGIGYKIVEQYLEHGRTLAAGATPASAERGDTGNPMADLASRMMRHTADLFEVWFQMMDASAAARPRPAPETPSSADHASPAPAAAAGSAPAPSAGVAIQVESSRPATVAVDLRSPAPGAVLVAHALRSDDESLPRITGVTVGTSANGAPVVIRVPVPDDQPDGIYNGMIIDQATSLPVGTVSVRLEAKGKAA